MTCEVERYKNTIISSVDIEVNGHCKTFYFFGEYSYPFNTIQELKQYVDGNFM